MKRKMRNIKATVCYVLMGVVITGCLIGCFSLLFHTPGKHAIIAKNIANVIRAELPFGSNRAQIEAWLKLKGLTNYGYEKVAGSENLSSVVSRSKYKPSQLSGVITVRLDTGRSLVTSWFMFVTFFFDRQGKFIDYSVEEGGIGL